MDSAAVRDISAVLAFEDGLGRRYSFVDPAGNDSSEMLCFRGELAAVPTFEPALRERVSHLAGFSHPYYSRIRTVGRLQDRGATLALVSEYRQGVRLSEILAAAERKGLVLDINAALCVIRQLLPAVALLHQNPRNVANGALAAERIVITPQARLVIVEFAMGPALEQLRFSRERYWKELRIALPPGAGLPRFDRRADVTQLGVIALSLILGRSLQEDEYPARVADVVASVWASSANGDREPLKPGLRSWLTRTLQLDVRNSFGSMLDAQGGLDQVLSEADYLAAPAALETVLSRLHSSVDQARDSVPVSRPSADVGNPETIAPSASLPTAPEHRRWPRAATALSSPVGDLEPARVERSRVEPAPEPLRPEIKEPEESVVEGSEESAPLPDRRDLPRIEMTPLNHADRPRTEHVRVDPVAEPARTERNDSPIAPTAAIVPADFLEMPMEAQHPRRSWRGLAAAGVVLATVAGGGMFAARRYAMPSGPVTTTGTLTITTNPPGAGVAIDGEPRGLTPLSLTLTAGAHVLEVRGATGPRTIPVTIAPGIQASQYIELPAAGGLARGQLQVRSDPSGARVIVDGTSRGVSPLTIDDLAPGPHSVALESDLGSVKQDVTIEAGTTASLMVPLTASSSASLSGWISISAPVSLQLYENGRLLGSSDIDQIMVPTGRHDIEVANDALGYRTTRTVQVAAGRVSPITIDLPETTVAVNAVPWAHVSVDGKDVGETPIGNLSLPIGSHEIVFRHPELGEQRRGVTVTLTSPLRLSVDLRKP